MNINNSNNINNKNINKNEDIIFRKLNLQKHSPNSLMQKYRNSNINRDSNYIQYNKVIKNKITKKNENPFSIDSIYNSKIDLLRQNYVRNNYEINFPNFKGSKPIKNNKNNTRTSLQAKTLKEKNNKKNNFFSEYDFSSEYFPPKKN